MRAVNLVPADNRRNKQVVSGGSVGPAHGVLGLLAVALIFVTISVLTSNTISSRKAKLSSLQSEVSQAKAAASSLTSYTEFQQVAQSRAQTVRQIVAARFDWDKALTDLSKVVPANASLQSLLGTVVPGATAGGGSGGSSTGGLRTDITAPAFEIRGCTTSQDEVAGLISRLRLINGVTRVSLSDSQKATQTAGAVSASSGSASSTGCAAKDPTFDLVVFFTQVPNAAADGATAVSTGSTAPGASTGAASAAPSSATPVTATTPATTTTPGAVPATTTPAASAPSGSQPVSNTTSSGVHP